jgi:ApbE superfamily uncharacterized protein (UPF0280 family)
MRSSKSRFEPRTYRRLTAAEGLVGFGVTVAQTDVWIWAEKILRGPATAAIQSARASLEGYIASHPEFVTSLTPLPCEDNAPDIVTRMCAAATVANVGPMASVAGAVAQFVAEFLESHSSEVIVENGGDVFLIPRRDRLVAIVAPGSDFSGRLALRVPAGERLGVCTSSGTVGPSRSFGRADVALIAAHDGALADAVATTLGNRVHQPDDIEPALDLVRDLPGIVHALVMIGGRMGTFGSLDLVPVRA